MVALKMLFTTRSLLGEKPCASAGVASSSFLQQIFAEKPYGRQKNHVETYHDSEPGEVEAWLRPKKPRGHVGSGNQDGRQHRQQEQRQNQLAQAGLRGDRRKRRAWNGNSETPQEENEEQLRQNREDVNVKEAGKEREHQ